MAEGFEELGLREELVDAIEEADFPRPTELQAAAIPVLRRGNNAVLHASSGAGVVAAYGLALLDRLSGEDVEPAEDDEGVPGGPPVRGLILTTTVEAANRVAQALAGFASVSGLRVLALAPGWAAAAEGADVVVATPRAALRAVASSALKLGALRALVLDGADVLLADAAEAVESLTSTIPAEAQRIVLTGEPDDVRSWVERHARRALTIPRTSVEGEALEGRGLLAYVVRPESQKLDALARLLAAHGGPSPLVFCRTDDRAAVVADALASRGFAVGPAGDTAADVAVAAASAEEVESSGHLPLSYDVPADPAALLARHASGGVVFVEPRELAHLRRLAARAGFQMRPRAEDVVDAAEEDAEGYRERLRAAAREEDLAAQLLMLEPLFAELSPAEVAAAASALVRRRPPAAPAAREAPAVAESPAATRAPAPSVRTAAPAPSTTPFTRLFVSIGSRDGARPGDLVGAITGEARISGDRVGKVDIRESFSLVEVATPDAERVISALNGTTVKGRSVRVDYHRERGAPGGARGRAPTGGRGGPRGPSRPGGPGARRGPREGGGSRGGSGG